MTDVLTVESVTAGYDGTAVLRDFSLTVAQGEVVALLGANGAGKTTAVRAISGMIRPYSGSICFGALDACAESPQRLAKSGLAHVPDSRGIFPELTVDEHFRLGSRKGSPSFQEALSYFPALGSLRRRRASLLSGGEQQMLALATALARRPSLLLIDELSLGLAPVAVERLLPVVRDYATDTGAGVVIVEQHIHLALRISDSGCVLAHGEVVMRGNRQQLQADRGLFVASYLGEANTTSAGSK